VQTLLVAGTEVNSALIQFQTAQSKTDIRKQQILSLESAVESTQLLMRHGDATYLEVLTAQQNLLSAQLKQISDRFEGIQGIVNLYQALGGGGQ
jgi:outer membrane protein TolC